MKSFKNLLWPILSTSLLVSCVNESSPGGGGKKESSQNEVVQDDGSNVQGIYAGEIWPVNYNLHFKSIGNAAVVREEDEFKVMVKLKHGPKEARIKQAIYTARRCPNLGDDLNKDAYIDILEARVAIGKITVPFDSDLNSQMGGHGQYPYVDNMGKMSYSQSGSFSSMFEDLKSVDENPQDDIIKSPEGITFPGRIVLFQGMTRKVDLPESVATTDGESQYESLPVGCAVLWKVPSMPAELTTP